MASARTSGRFGSQYSLVSGSDVTPAVLEVWKGLPEDVKYDPVFGPLCRVQERDDYGTAVLFRPLLSISLLRYITELKKATVRAFFHRRRHRDGADGAEVAPNGCQRGAIHHHNEESTLDTRTKVDDETRPLKQTELIEMKNGIREDCMYSNSFSGNRVKKKETNWSRAKRYCKISFLLACWAFYTTILLLYSEKDVVERHTSLNAGETKTYQIQTKASSLRVWVGLDGPFWSELQQRKYRGNLTDRDSVMEVWLEGEEESMRQHGNRTDGRKSKPLRKSKSWVVCLLDSTVIDFSEGELRSTVLRLDESLAPLSAVSLHSFSIKMRHNANVTVPFTVSYTKNPLDAKTGIAYAAVLLIGLYVIIIFDLINRTLAAVIVSTTSIAVLALVGERPTMLEILSWMDVETLLLLFSMMLLVTLLAETGVFDYLAVIAFERTRGETWPLINMLYLLTIVVSLFLDNVTTVLLLTPATIRLCEVTGLSPLPVLMGMVLFCNVGGTATPVGDPPNIIIATNPIVIHAGINFTNFTLHMGLGVVLVFVQTYLQFRFMFRDANMLRAKERPQVQELKTQLAAWKRASDSLKNNSAEDMLVKKAVDTKLYSIEDKLHGATKQEKISLPQEMFETTLKELKEKYQIRNKTLLVQSLIAIAFIVIVFFLHSLPQAQSLSLGWSALLGTTMLLVLADKDDLQPVLSKIEWSTLLFFAALFICMEAITKLGLIQWIGGMTESLILSVSEQYQLPVAILLILWVSGVTSAFVDNIPLTSMMVRVVTSLGSNPSLSLPMAPLIWALSFGACMGGNGTLVGASANVITAGVAEQHNYKITFKEFFKIGAPMTLGHLITVSVYLLVAHCLFTWH